MFRLIFDSKQGVSVKLTNSTHTFLEKCYYMNSRTPKWRGEAALDKEKSIEPMNTHESIILFPDFEKLKNEVEKLRIELTMMVLERDELLYVECKNIEMTYMLAIGYLEYKAFELECALLRLKRKAEMIQAKKNRQELVDLVEIEGNLDKEFAEYQALLNQQIEKMNAALARKEGEELSAAEVKELKQLYRAIVKALHPDLHSGMTQASIRLFHHAVKTYENADLVELRMIYTMVGEPQSLEEKPNSLAELRSEKDRLSKLLQSIQDRITDIKSSYPYTMKSFLQSPEKINKREAELKETISQMKEDISRYDTKIKEMVR